MRLQVCGFADLEVKWPELEFPVAEPGVCWDPPVTLWAAAEGPQKFLFVLTQLQKRQKLLSATQPERFAEIISVTFYLPPRNT